MLWLATGRALLTHEVLCNAHFCVSFQAANGESKGIFGKIFGWRKSNKEAHLPDDKNPAVSAPFPPPLACPLALHSKLNVLKRYIRLVVTGMYGYRKTHFTENFFDG